MKKLIKTSLLLILSLICVKSVNQQATNVITSDLSALIKKVVTYKVTATMYHPVASQCDADPNLTAGMFHIPRNATAKKWIAMSRDFIDRWGGEFHYGDFVRISGAGHKDGIYRVVDTMNKRYKKRIDFLESKGTKPYKFTNVQITKICNQNQEKQVANS